MTLRTLTDVRELRRHLPEDRRARTAWLHLATELERATAGADTADMALSIEDVEFRQAQYVCHRARS